MGALWVFWVALVVEGPRDSCPGLAPPASVPSLHLLHPW